MFCVDKLLIVSILCGRLISVLDQVEMRVERLRRDTARIAEERDSLLATLDSVNHSDLLTEITDCEYIFGQTQPILQ